MFRALCVSSSARLSARIAAMVAKQRIRMANEKHSKNITQRGNVAKSSVSAECEGCGPGYDMGEPQC